MKSTFLHMQAPAPRPVPAKDIPTHLRVCCGTMRGNFDVQRALVILDGGREISPTEFERMAGKAASKKWKASVRIDKVSMYVELWPEMCHHRIWAHNQQGSLCLLSKVKGRRPHCKVTAAVPLSRRCVRDYKHGTGIEHMAGKLVTS